MSRTCQEDDFTPQDCARFISGAPSLMAHSWSRAHAPLRTAIEIANQSYERITMRWRAWSFSSARMINPTRDSNPISPHAGFRPLARA